MPKSDSDLISKAKRIKSIHESEWMEWEEVVGVGIGLVDENPGIIISVKSAADSTSKKIPSEIDGVPIKVLISGEFFAS